VAASGGTLRYTKTGDALDGLTITVPANAYTSSSQWTVIADSTISVPWPAGTSEVGPALVITNSQGYATTPITLTMPMTVPPGTFVAPYYYDPVTKQLEGIPLVDLTATSATLAAQQFSNDFLATRGPTASAVRAGALRANATAAFGNVIVVWVKAPESDLKGTFGTDFKPGRDDWEFVNYGDYVSPGGDCEGMSLTAMYYQFFVRDPKQTSYGLYHQYDSSLPNTWDNVQGIRFAGSVQGDITDRFDKGTTGLKAIMNKSTQAGTRVDNLTASWLMLTFKLTGNPVLMAIYGPTVAHSVVAYGGTSSGSTVTVKFADPNAPGTERTMTFEGGKLTPLPFSNNAASSADDITSAYALGVTAELPLKEIDGRYAEFKAKTAGKDRYPASYSWVYFNETAVRWDVIPAGAQATIRTSDKQFRAGLLCTNCPAKDPTVTPDGLMLVRVYDENGVTLLGTTDSPVTLTRGEYGFSLVAVPRSPYASPAKPGFVDYRPLTVIYTPKLASISLQVNKSGTTRAAQGSEVVVRGDTLLLAAVVKDADGAVAQEPVTWSSSDATIARVSTTGVVTTPSVGSATITATSASLSTLRASVVVNVTAPAPPPPTNTNPIATLTLAPKPTSVVRGTTRQFSVTLKDAAGNVTSLPAGVTVGYAVDDSNLGSINSSSGLFTASATRTGTTTVRAFLLGSGAPTTIFDASTVTITN
jgi:hypothetical protein